MAVDVIDLPERGTPERQVLIRRIAAKVWEGRDDRSFEEAGEFWQFRWERLVTEVVEAIEAEIVSASGCSPSI